MGILSVQKVNAQEEIINSAKSSSKYIYSITNKEALYLYKNGLEFVNNTFFHTLIDSFPYETEYEGLLKDGYYLITGFDKNYQSVEILGEFEFGAFVVNNYKDLNIRVSLTDGTPIDNAVVKINNKELDYNPQLELYTLTKTNKKGILSVEYKGNIAYYELNRQVNNPKIKRLLLKGANSIPLRYIISPAYYIINLPIDGVKSIKRNYACGTIYSTKNFFQKRYNDIACLLNSWECEDYNFSKKCQTAVLFNKPIYKPGDTVFYKIFISKKRGKGINKPVYITVGEYRNNFDLPELYPYARGVYHGSFILHDSLNIKLDNHLLLWVSNKREMDYGEGSFKYEDYELKSNNLDVRTLIENHYLDSVNRIYYSAKDDNGLPVFDGRLEILVKTKEVIETFGEEFFLPDTLWHEEVSLLKQKETEIEISPEIFPPANISYEVVAKLYNTENEIITKTSSFKYLYKETKPEIEIVKDSIKFRILENGKEIEEKAIIKKEDLFGNSSIIFEGSTPLNL